MQNHWVEILVEKIILVNEMKILIKLNQEVNNKETQV